MYTQAASSDPGVGAYDIESYYNYFGPAMKYRYQEFKKNVVRQAATRESGSNAPDGTNRRKSISTVESFALNDYGNACLSYSHRLGDLDQLEDAIQSYTEAIRKDTQNRSAYFNLHNAYLWKSNKGDFEEAIQCLDEAREQVQRGLTQKFSQFLSVYCLSIQILIVIV